MDERREPMVPLNVENGGTGFIHEIQPMSLG